MFGHELCLLLQGFVELAALQLLLFLLFLPFFLLLLLLLLLLLHSALFLLLMLLLQSAILLLNEGNIAKQLVHQLAYIAILVLTSLPPHNFRYLSLDLFSEAPDLLIVLVETDDFREIYDGRFVQFALLPAGDQLYVVYREIVFNEIAVVMLVILLKRSVFEL